MLYDTVRRLAGVIATVLYRPTIEGRDHVPSTGPVILASNHLSFSDHIVIPLAVSRRVRFLAKSEYFTGPGLKGRLSKATFEALGAVPVKRGTNRDAMTSLHTGLDLLAHGEAFAVYPEGTRSRDGRLYRGRTGVAYLALTSGAPVVPVALLGTQDLQPIGTRIPRIRPITVRFGPAMDFSTGYDHIKPSKARRVVTDDIMDAIAALSGQEQVEAYNTYPPTDDPT
ncbi:lysophospholipid acyltransferase family protein [Salinactinospora qingdaonensis]|uniref:Lysophospholipid acyltransferase family protein n=1 Tax=Salinactinospora qingdaonensis TaxID=702744 RepID=A0ABP7G3K9_9ACTN